MIQDARFTPPSGQNLRWRVVGSGPVALALVALAVRQGMAPGRIWLDPAPAEARPLPEALAARAIALSQGSAQLLSRVITLPAAGRIEQVEVSMRGQAGRTRIEAREFGVPDLGRVVRYGALIQALRNAVGGLALACEGPVDVIIHAEGDPGDDAHIRRFGQSALLGEVRAYAARPETTHTAFERFTPAGPLALLPLPEPGRYSLVWCDTPEACEARRQAPLETLTQTLCERFGAALGPLQPEGPFSVYPLERRARRTLVSGREVWIGNAAQALHPVAGQGLNLGLRDAFELARALCRSAQAATGVEQTLARWARSRRADRRLTLTLTDLMAASFTWPLARPLQSPMLTALDLIPALRRPLARHLMFGLR